MGTLVSHSQITLRDLYLCKDVQSLVPRGPIFMVYQGLISMIVKLSSSQAGLSLMSRFRICGAVHRVPQCTGPSLTDSDDTRCCINTI